MNDASLTTEMKYQLAGMQRSCETHLLELRKLSYGTRATSSNMSWLTLAWLSGWCTDAKESLEYRLFGIGGWHKSCESGSEE